MRLGAGNEDDEAEAEADADEALMAESECDECPIRLKLGTGAMREKGREG